MQTLNLNGPSVAVQAEPETPTRDWGALAP